MNLRGSSLANVVTEVLLALDTVLRCVPRGATDRALIVRPDAVGDHFVWLRTGAVDVSGYARSQAQRATLLASPAVAPYARLTGLWDDVVELDEMRFAMQPLYRWRLLWRIRRLGASLLIQTRTSRALWLEDAIVRVCGAPSRIGPTGTLLRQNAWQRRRGGRFYDRLIPVDGSRETHESIRNAQFAKGLTGQGPTPFRFVQPAVAPSGGHVLIALGAGARGRVWPVEKLAALLTHIATTHPQVPIVVAGTRGDAADALRLQALSGVSFDSRVGSTSLSQFVELIASSRLVVCNESAAYHIAMAYERDVVCLLGGGHFGIFVPYPPVLPGETARPNRVKDVALHMPCFGCDWWCIYPRAASGAHRCVEDIPLERVARDVDELLAAANV